jgi:hypothetical protein
MVKLSVTSKLDGIRSWSLQAKDTCPGSVKANGELVNACFGCYASMGFYVFAKAKSLREYNKEDWQREEWVAEMVKALANDRYFRWLDSGDLYSLALAVKVYEVMAQTPWVQHWLPTRMAKFDKFKPVLAKMQALPNVMVRFSSDDVNGSFTPGVHGSTIVPDADWLKPGVTMCEAYSRGGKCDGCRACWSKDVAVVAYPIHGKRKNKMIMLAKAVA